MKRIKNYLQNWDNTRLIKLILSLVLFAAYSIYPIQLLMAFAVILSVQAVLNLSCPGGSCNVPVKKNTETTIKTEEYNPKND